jgi:hypothetical protein
MKQFLNFILILSTTALFAQSGSSIYNPKDCCWEEGYYSSFPNHFPKCRSVYSQDSSGNWILRSKNFWDYNQSNLITKYGRINAKNDTVLTDKFKWHSDGRADQRVRTASYSRYTPFSKVRFSYNASNKIIKKTHVYPKALDSAVVEERYKYDNQGNVSGFSAWTKDSGSTQFSKGKISHYTNIYNSGKIASIKKLDSVNSGTSWSFSGLKKLYTYHNNGSIFYETDSVYMNNAWQPNRIKIM